MSRYVLDDFGLNGWSTWGWDDGLGSYFAQMWAGDTTHDSDDPDVWLGTRPGEYVDLDDLAEDIAAALPDLSTDEVLADAGEVAGALALQVLPDRVTFV